MGFSLAKSAFSNPSPCVGFFHIEAEYLCQYTQWHKSETNLLLYSYPSDKLSDMENITKSNTWLVCFQWEVTYSIKVNIGNESKHSYKREVESGEFLGRGIRFQQRNRVKISGWDYNRNLKVQSHWIQRGLFCTEEQSKEKYNNWRFQHGRASEYITGRYRLSRRRKRSVRIIQWWCIKDYLKNSENIQNINKGPGEW